MIRDYTSVDPNMALTFINGTNAISGTDGDHSSAESVGHRLLIQPNAHNILIAYEPTKSFLLKIECHKSGYNYIYFKKIEKLFFLISRILCEIFLENCENFCPLPSSYLNIQHSILYPMSSTLNSEPLQSTYSLVSTRCPSYPLPSTINPHPSSASSSVI